MPLSYCPEGYCVVNIAGRNVWFFNRVIKEEEARARGLMLIIHGVSDLEFYPDFAIDLITHLRLPPECSANDKCYATEYGLYETLADIVSRPFLDREPLTLEELHLRILANNKKRSSYELRVDTDKLRKYFLDRYHLEKFQRPYYIDWRQQSNGKDRPPREYTQSHWHAFSEKTCTSYLQEQVEELIKKLDITDRESTFNAYREYESLRKRKNKKLSLELQK